jgi:cyclophilin family peptidyl-prolyl cis-trans isomerase
MPAKHSRMSKLFLVMTLGVAIGCGGEATSDAKEEAARDDEPRPAKKPPKRSAAAPAKRVVQPIPTPAKEGYRDEQAPASFSVALETTKGEIVIDVQREWAPRGADRFFTLVENGYYTDVAFFRVIEGFMAQAGISSDPATNAIWRTRRLKDDPVRQSNEQGMVSFAMGGPNSRTTQFFISFEDNSRLDGMGFAPFGKVRDMAVVNELYAGYGEGAPRGKGPSQRRLQLEGGPYLKKEFPKMDYIKKARVLE